MLDIAHPIQDVRTRRAVASRDIERQRMDAWLSAKISDGLAAPLTENVTLTPVLAQLLLDRNEANRTVSALSVEKYASDIKGGRWSFNGETIIISREGLLNDGQHRCLAVVEAGRPIQVILAFGFERETRMTLDQGGVRTTGHFLSMKGHVDTNGLASVVGMIWQHRERGYLSRSGHDRPTKSQALLVADHFKDIPDSLAFIQKTNGVSTRSLLAFAHWTLAQRAGKQLANEFISKLIDGAALSDKDPILYVRNRLTNRTERFTPNERVDLIFKAWNAWRRGDMKAHLRATNGALPKLER